MVKIAAAILRLPHKSAVELPNISEMNLLTFLAIFALHIVVQVEALDAATSQLVKLTEARCFVATGADPDTVNKFKRGQDDPSQSLKEFLFCFWRIIGVVTNDGDFRIEVMRKVLNRQFSAEVIEQVVEHCAEKKANRLQTAYEFTKCSYKYKPDDMDLEKV